MAAKPKTLDSYLATVPPAQRAALEKLRKAIRAVVPTAEECFSYNLPAFRLHGAVVAGFCALKNHCSYFPFSGTTIETLKHELEGYETTSGSIHFQPNQPLSSALVRKLIKARIAEIASKKEASDGRPKNGRSAVTRPTPRRR